MLTSCLSSNFRAQNPRYPSNLPVHLHSRPRVDTSRLWAVHGGLQALIVGGCIAAAICLYGAGHVAYHSSKSDTPCCGQEDSDDDDDGTFGGGAMGGKYVAADSRKVRGLGVACSC